jgi:uncharacterized protein (TIGR03437 family)
MIVFGGLPNLSSPLGPLEHLVPTNAVWVLSNANGQGGTPVWTNLVAEGATGSPPVRAFHTAVYDTGSNRMTIFGGSRPLLVPLPVPTDSSNPEKMYNDAWVLTHANGLGGIPTWSQVTSSAAIEAVVNGASNLSGDISPGEIVVLNGSGIGPTQLTRSQVGSDGLMPTQVGGTTVQFDDLLAPIVYASATQIAAVVPYQIGGTSAQVAVTHEGQHPDSIIVSVASSAPGVTSAAPGLFTLDSSGSGQAAAINQDGSVNTVSTPARPGGIISLYMTGEGNTSPAVDGKIASSPLPHPVLPVTVTIGGQSAQVQYAGGAPGLVAGVMQVNAVVPAGISPGNRVPVVVQVGNVPSQPGVTIAVAGN